MPRARPCGPVPAMVNRPRAEDLKTSVVLSPDRRALFDRLFQELCRRGLRHPYRDSRNRLIVELAEAAARRMLEEIEGGKDPVGL